MLQLEEKSTPAGFALFALGFRPFFSAAGLFAVVSVLLWMAMYVFAVPLAPAGLPPVYWHGHEMIYGYVMAVVAGFLLTAVGNWTGITSFRGTALVALGLLWLAARVAFFLPFEAALTMAAAADLLFALGLIAGVSLPVIRVRQWKQLGIISLLCLMLAGNAMFYAGALGYLDSGLLRSGLYTGLYFILALIFMMARRVIPFFIERGVEEKFTAGSAPRWVDIGGLVLFLVWLVADVFARQPVLVAGLSMVLFAIHLWRLRDWYTPGIWKVPLLWSLYLGYVFLVLGLLLKALTVWQAWLSTLALHAFAFGGIGMITLGMMARVALGHTGRNVFDPPKVLAPMFVLLALGACIRVFAPIVDGSHYTLWIAVSQLLWILGFGIFSAVYIPILLRPRVDGRAG